MNLAFWKGRHVFVTGHTGFKGSWLSLWLQEAGAHLTGYSLPAPTQPSLFQSADIASGMASIVGDVRDLPSLQKAMAQSQAEVVLHLAAQSLVRYSYDNPLETYEVNVMGTAHLLEAARRVPSIRAIVIVTSDKCYENREWVWGYRENEAMGGHDPYSSSKGCAELVTGAYAASYFPAQEYARHGVAIASARAGNVIGGGDWAKDRLLPDIIRAIQAGEPVIIRNPDAVRPWQHVLEPLRGYLALAQSLLEQGPAFNGGWNFGPAEADTHPVSWIVENITRAWGEGARWELDGREHPHEAHHLKLDCSKAKNLLDWKPALALPAALNWIAAWYREYYLHCGDSVRIRDLAVKEIGRYEELLRC